ncbi:MAG: ATP-binding protein, partial [Burkholderiaceae bacterium]|nr:ATP-binding protein [Burkholderiaceae bacterium]
MRLTQVFSNLLQNACKYTPEGGEITLRAQRQDESVVIRIKIIKKARDDCAHRLWQRKRPS